MPIDGSAMRRWARGESPNPDEDDEDEIGEAKRNPVWAGEVEPEDIDEEAAEELLDWLETNEPDIHAAILEVAMAVEEDDEEALAAATENLIAAEQLLNPEYEPMGESDRKAASKNIAQHMRDKGKPAHGSPEWKQAVAIGMAEARRGKKH